MLTIASFLFWGTFGMLVEIWFTGIVSLIRNHNFEMHGYVSLWMFPIYGFGLTLGWDLISYLITNTYVRWLSYPFWIWLVEILIGCCVLQFEMRLWDYRDLPDGWHWEGIISYIHYPAWLVFGIIVESIRHKLVL
jgi:hypothetical protein